MSFEFESYGDSIHVPLRPDERGYLGRECPVADCEGYFLVKLGTGLTGHDQPCHCPYCGHAAGADHFFTKEQIEYAQSVAIRQLTDTLLRDLKSMEFDYPAQGPFGIGISMKLTPGAPTPIHYYREKALETFVACAACALEYGVYGVFGYCPDCGVHNSLQILERNLDLTRRQVDLSESLADVDLRRHLLEDALENCVSALDGFGREAVRVRAARSSDPARCAGVSFQNLVSARKCVLQLFGVDFSASVDSDTWEAARRGFMKRHVIAHRAGVVDQAYVDQTLDPHAVVGRKVAVSASEVRSVAEAVLCIGRAFVVALPRPSN